MNLNTFKYNEFLEIALMAGADPDARENTYTLLMKTKGSALPLIRAGANLELRNKDLNTALFFAVWDDSIDRVEELIDHGADYMILNTHFNTPFDYAKKDTEVWRYFKRNGFDNVLCERSGRNRLHGINKLSKQEIADLIKKGVNVNGNDCGANGDTPLHCLVAGNGSEEEIIEKAGVLLANRANVNGRNLLGHTPLHYAVRYPRVNVVKFLIEKGAYVNPFDDTRRTPLIERTEFFLDALTSKHISRYEEEFFPIIKLLLKDKSKLTKPLSIAAEADNVELVKILLEAGGTLMPGRHGPLVTHYLRTLEK